MREATTKSEDVPCEVFPFEEENVFFTLWPLHNLLVGKVGTYGLVHRALKCRCFVIQEAERDSSINYPGQAVLPLAEQVCPQA